MEKKNVVVGMSGGVDSSLAASILLSQGFNVIGVTLKLWDQDGSYLNSILDAQTVCNYLCIRHIVIDLSAEFKNEVVNNFCSIYLQGKTPNPCVLCNELIKFGLLLQKATALGADFLATGHYACIQKAGKTYFLKKALDLQKDQSYFLYRLKQSQLRRIIFPLSGFTKTQIRQLALKEKLPVAHKTDSQEICFIPDNDYGGFVEKEFSPRETVPSLSIPGTVKLKNGTVLGKHDGYFHFTHGQRRGINIAYKEKLYVLDIKPETNEVIVGTKEDVLGQKFIVERVNWHAAPPSETFEAHVKIRSQHADSLASAPPAQPAYSIGHTFTALVKIRSQHKKAPAIITVIDKNKIEVCFLNKQEAITPGQGAVLYDGSVVLAGGWIASPQTSPGKSV